MIGIGVALYLVRRDVVGLRGPEAVSPWKRPFHLLAVVLVAVVIGSIAGMSCATALL